MAGFILANSSLSSNQFAKDEISKTIIEVDHLSNFKMLSEA
jgi:hypothetical protein